MARATSLFTIGYEGRTPADLVAALRAQAVKTLVDVRELPLSRRRGFSKTALAATLRRAGIAYEHVRALGTPRDLRVRLRESGDRARFLREFRRHLEDQGEALGHLASLARSSRTALLCLERDAHQCHRSEIAARLCAGGSFTVVHL